MGNKSTFEKNLSTVIHRLGNHLSQPKSCVPIIKIGFFIEEVSLKNSWNNRGISMEYSWNKYGWSMDAVWKFVWIMYGICMD